MEASQIDFDKLISMLESELDTMEFEHYHYDYEYKNQKYYAQLLECVKIAKEHSMM